jgi:predicted RNA binding protein YcfA (HicA-like mRNA interferase family)
MSPKLLPVTCAEIVKLLLDAGYTEIPKRSGTSHRKFYRASDNRTATIPEHGKKPLGKGLIAKIEKDTLVAMPRG